MTDIKTNVFANYNTDFAAAQADNSGGYNSWFPEDGVYDCVVTNIVQVNATFREKTGTETIEHPGTLIKFQYTLLEDPGSKGAPRSFDGGPFVFPDCGKEGLTTENSCIRVDIALKRLKGHITAILGDVASPGSGLQQIAEMTQTEQIPVRVKCESKTSKSNSSMVFTTEYIIERLTEES